MGGSPLSRKGYMSTAGSLSLPSGADFADAGRCEVPPKSQKRASTKRKRTKLVQLWLYPREHARWTQVMDIAGKDNLSVFVRDTMNKLADELMGNYMRIKELELEPLEKAVADVDDEK